MSYEAFFYLILCDTLTNLRCRGEPLGDLNSYLDESKYQVKLGRKVHYNIFVVYVNHSTEVGYL